jgi:hypothetical protein
MARDDSGDDPPPPGEEARQSTRFQRLGEQLTGLLDPEAALRRGAGIVTGVSQATKEELMRIVGAEVRRFLDNMNITDLAQHIIAGLVLDVNMQIRFSRQADGTTQPEVTKADADVRTEGASPRAKDKSKSGKP